MIKHILCATDFSDFAKNATRYALQFAKDIDAKVVLLHVSQPQAFLAHSPGDIMEQIWNEHETEMKKQMSDVVGKLVKEDKDLEGIDLEFEVRSGLVVEEVMLVADELDTDLIITGTHGKSGYKDLLFGNHTSGIISRADLPVMTVPGTVKYKAIKKIGYAVDFTDFDNEDMQTLIALKKQMKAELEIVHVDVEQGEASEEQIANFTEMVSNLFGIKKVNYEFLEGNKPLAALIDYVDNTDIDLLAMKHHHRNFLGQLLGKSVTKTMADVTTVPLLIFED